MPEIQERITYLIEDLSTWNEDYLIFNDSIVQESAGSPRWATLKVTSETDEARRPFRFYPLWSLNLSNLQLSPLQYEQLLAFQYVIRGMLNPFLVRNSRNCLFQSFPSISNPTGVPSQLGVGNGSKTTFQLVKHHRVQGRNAVEVIRYPNYNYPTILDLNEQPWSFLPTLTIYLDGVEQEEGWTVDRSTGVVTFDDAPNEDAVVTARGGFYTLMTANVDEIPAKPVGPIWKIESGVTFSEPTGGE